MLFQANYGFSEWNREESLENRRPYTATKWFVMLCVPFYSHWLWKGKRGHQAVKSGDYRTALDLWMPLARKGDAEAQFRVGLLNEKGLGGAPDVERAVRLYARAAAAGHWRALLRIKDLARKGTAIAQYHLGENHITGFADNRSERKAQIWFERAANQGLAEAEVALGRTYLPPCSSWGAIGRFFGQLLTGWRGPKRDKALAIRWFQAAADKGNAEGIFQLGLLYLLGHYVEQDVRAGLALMEDAAGRGFGHAQISLAIIYSEGEYLPPDAERASYWFREGERQITRDFKTETLVCFGIAYREGWGTAPNKVLAYKWFRLAEHKDKYQFRATFGPLIKDLKKTMTKDEIRSAIGLIEAAYDEELEQL